MEPVSSSADNSGLILAGLGTRQSVKSKRVDMVYSHNALYKKPKKPVVGNVIDSSADLLSMESIGGVGVKPGVFWGSKVGSIANSVSDLSDIKNMANTVAKKTSYTELGKVDNMDDTTPRKTHIRTYILGNPLKPNQSPPLELCALEMQCFNLMKSFVLDIELFAMPGKLVSDKLISLKKIFYQVNGFGGAFTPLKFSGIIKSSFTSESSLNKTKVLAISNNIIVNDDFRKLIGLWQKALLEFESSEVACLVAFKWDQHWALLYTLSVGTTAYDLSGLVEAFGEKTCFIGCNPAFYVQDKCTVICFEDETSKLAVIGSVPIFKDKAGTCTGPSPGAKSFVDAWSSFNGADSYGVSTNQISGIVKKLSFVELVSLPPAFHESFLAVSTPLAPEVNSDMVLDGVPKPSALLISAVVNDTSGFSSSSSKILTTKVGGLELKMTSLEASISLVLIGWIICVLVLVSYYLLHPNEWFGLEICYMQRSGYNVPAKQLNIVCWHMSSGNTVFFITKTKLRSSSGLRIKDKYDGVWIFTSGLDVGNLGAGVAVVMNNSLACHVSKVEMVSGQIISVRLLFKDKLLVSVLGLYAGASVSIHFGQASEINSIIAKAVNTSTFMVLGGNFNECRPLCYGGVGQSGWTPECSVEWFNCLVEKWSTLDFNKALVLRDMVYTNQKMMNILKYLSIVRKEYRKSKIYELKLAQEASIRAAIEKHMEKFCSNKGSIIRSVLDRSFWKMVLNHLVVNDKLVLDLDGVRLNVDRIMESWTRKCVVPSVLFNHWACQYVSLDYVRDNIFFGVMNVISISELFVVVGSLPNGKAAGLSGILNKLWKHGGESVMECLLVLLNECLFVGTVPALWKRAWVLMIPKPYD
ncbi:hypothetical protein G9A89_004717 [Geosiphon pyriformis]|nr:hypothetical protein G9A89_004717 [Geosiphon pyriformis]